VTPVVVKHIPDEPEPEPEPDEAEYRADGAKLGTAPEGEPVLDPEEVVGLDPYGYPETRARRRARLERRGAASGLRKFDRGGRPI
jgi:hypothetical protein